MESKLELLLEFFWRIFVATLASVGILCVYVWAGFPIWFSLGLALVVAQLVVLVLFIDLIKIVSQKRIIKELEGGIKHGRTRNPRRRTKTK